MAHHIAQIVQFGDFKGWGAWAQVGYALNTKWSVWGFYGTDRPDSTQLANAALVTEGSNAAIAGPARRSAAGRSPGDPFQSGGPGPRSPRCCPR